MVSPEGLGIIISGILAFLLIFKQVRNVWFRVLNRELHKKPVDRSSVLWWKVISFFLVGIVLFFEMTYFLTLDQPSGAFIGILMFMLVGVLFILWGLGIYYIQEGGASY